MTILERARRRARIPMVQWEDACKSLSQTDAMALSDTAAQEAVLLARYSAYLSRLRVTGGNHTDAVKQQNFAARKVRQALGYTYADDAILF
jgi:hypothetical protein